MKQHHNDPPLLDELLAAVAGMQDADTAPFFYTRLRGRMQQKTGWNFPVKPAWIITGLVLLLLVNGFILANRSTNDHDNNTVTKSSLQQLAAAYDLALPSTY
jgi:hypothetical protein